MGRPKKSTTMVRFAIPLDVYQRFDRMGQSMGMDAAMAIRVLASLQLAQFESTHAKADTSDASVLPEGSHEIVKAEPEDVKHFLGLRPGPRSELDEPHHFEVIGSPLTAPGSEWIGYMRGL
jgi:hypothetical protein